MTDSAVADATSAAPSVSEADLERHRGELTAYAYRMLGSPFEAEDAVQETMLRAWRASDRFEGRSSLRSWLYRITTNVSLDMLNQRDRRVRPMDLAGPGAGDGPLGDLLPEVPWLEPIPDGQVLGSTSDPAEQAVARESVRLAFVAALQHLPPKQRAVLILREVLRWRAAEVAELLDTSVQSVNSALQRARATLQGVDAGSEQEATGVDPTQEELLARYVDAFERYDMDALTALLRHDATWNMPPFALWLQTHGDIVTFCQGLGAACRGSRLVPVQANGMPAFGQYKPSEDGSTLEPWSLQVLETSNGEITGITFFLDTQRLFPLFGLPLTFGG